jgi:hypothetical protein
MDDSSAAIAARGAEQVLCQSRRRAKPLAIGAATGLTYGRRRRGANHNVGLLTLSYQIVTR